MSQLVGKTFLGNTFVQDPNVNFVKIDGVVLGESDQYGYTTIQGFDIGNILQTCLQDPKIIAIVYNWTDGVAYTKIGLDLTTPGDSALNAAYTTFIAANFTINANVLLLGTQLLGSNFVQDPNPNFIKIDGVTLGECSQFGYTITGFDIGNILQTCLQDPKAIAVVYNWTAGIAYVKGSFNTLLTADSTSNNLYTSFIVTTRAPPIALSTRVNEFVQVTNGNFTLNGRIFVPVGVNAFFLGLMQETMSYPTNAQITEIFEAARTMKATVIRSHTLGFSAQNTMTLLGSNNIINANAWAPIDWAYAEAKRCSIKLIIVLCDPYEYYHGSLNTFCEPYGIAKDQFFINPVARTAFKKYIMQYLTHINQFTGYAIKDNIVVACLELGNELGNIRPDAGSTALPTQDWIADISAYIKTLTKILVLNGSDECLGGATSNDFAVSTVDVYSQHFYWDNKSAISSCGAQAMRLNKPYIIGEYSSKFNIDWFNEIESSCVKGSFAWSMYPHNNGQCTGARLNHDDGFTFWFDTNDTSNTNVILQLSNHFRRMQKLAIINSF